MAVGSHSRKRSAARFGGAVLALLLAAGCTSAVAGSPAKIGSVNTPSQTQTDDGPTGPKAGVAPATIAVTDDGHTPYDTLAKNTIDDLYTFYSENFPTEFGKPFTEAKELKSYDSNDSKATVCGRSLYKSVNASYNPSCDTIVWDRGVLLPEITKDIGQLGVPTILAHEMGHLVQNRLDVDESQLTRVMELEQQADCYAGAYWRWVADGHSKYYDLNQSAGVRQVLQAIMSTSDPAGLPPSAQQAHGSAFDRSYALSLGFTNGMQRCNKIDEAEVTARVKETGFTVIPTDFANVAIDNAFLGKVATVLNSYFAPRFPGYQPPTLTPAGGDTAVGCDGAATQSPVAYCPSSNTVSYSLPALVQAGTPDQGFDSKKGDFSAVILLASRYALAAESIKGASTTGDQAGLRALCYAGSWANWMRSPQGPDKLELSPNDLDKAVYEVVSAPTAATDSTGHTSTRVIDQVQALYVGVVNTPTRCYDYYAS